MRMTLIALMFFLSCATQAEELERLFHTPEERAKMDRPAESEIESPDTTPILNGIVQRSDGTRTIWINGAAQQADGRKPVAGKVGQPLPQGRQP